LFYRLAEEEESYQMRYTTVGIGPTPKYREDINLFLVAHFQPQLITSWGGEGETTANSLPIPPHRSAID